METKSLNKNLHKASKAKKDEFYTQSVDIENELKHYKKQFQSKVVYCNCDDPFESNFFKYLAANFNAFGLKKLITTSYIKSPIVGGQLPLFEVEGLKPSGKEPFKIEITEVPDADGDGAVNLGDVEYLPKHDIGYIIAFSFTKGAYGEVVRVKHNGLHIELLAVDKLLEYEEEAKQGKLL